MPFMPSAFFLAEQISGSTVIRGAPRHRLGTRDCATEQWIDENHFAEWSWDGQRLEASNDRYGMRPLFWIADKQRVAISESLETLVAECRLREIDFDALAVFLRLGHFIGDDTAFSGVKVLSPGSRLVWEAGRFELRIADFPPRVASGTVSPSIAQQRHTASCSQMLWRVGCRATGTSLFQSVVDVTRAMCFLNSTARATYPSPP